MDDEILEMTKKKYAFLICKMVVIFFILIYMAALTINKIFKDGEIYFSSPVNKIHLQELIETYKPSLDKL